MIGQMHLLWLWLDQYCLTIVKLCVIVYLCRRNLRSYPRSLATAIDQMMSTFLRARIANTIRKSYQSMSRKMFTSAGFANPRAKTSDDWYAALEILINYKNGIRSQIVLISQTLMISLWSMMSQRSYQKN